MRIGTRHLPLNALQGFEAAARHLNMRLAGAELNLTPSAVSHQVRALERALGLALFEPNRRRLVLTAEGRRLLSAVREGLEGIAATALQICEEGFAASLSVAAPPAFSSQWLVPRLPRFLALYPDLTFSLVPLPAALEGGLPRVDVAVTFNAVEFPGMRVETLAELEMFPVCAPALAPVAGVMAPEALREATLIHEDGGAIWARWFAATGVAQVTARRNVHVSGTTAALALARAGVGLAIDDGFMGGAGSGLVRPFGSRSLGFGQYSLVTQPPERLSPAALAFTDWMRREVAARLSPGRG